MSVRGMYSGGVAADTGGTKLIATMRERVRTMSEPRLREQRWDDAVRALRNATTVDEVREIIRRILGNDERESENDTNAAADPFSG